MSENKYIIDKDSLTGIADAVRDKLGNGEAITDEDAGYYPAPSLVGVKAPNMTLVLGTGNSGTNTYGLNLDESPYESLYGNNPFSKVEIFGSYFDSGLYTSQVRIDINFTDCIMTYNSTAKTFSATCSFESPQNSFLMAGYTNGSISPSYSSSRTFTFSAMHFILKDANDNIIPPKLENLPVTWNRYRSTDTWTVVTGDMYYQEIMTPIPFSIDDIQDKITNYLEKKSTIPIDYEGLSYGYITVGGSSSFMSSSAKNNFLTFISLRAGQKIGFCVGETTSNRLRAGFFKGKTYNNFSYYVMNSSSSSSAVYNGGISITGSSELSGDGLLKRFYYTAPADGILVVGTSNESKLAFLHVWEATE